MNDYQEIENNVKDTKDNGVLEIENNEKNTEDNGVLSFLNGFEDEVAWNVDDFATRTASDDGNINPDNSNLPNAPEGWKPP